jgi:hypothetical protein
MGTKQFGVRPTRTNVALFKKENPITPLNGGDTVGYDD